MAVDLDGGGDHFAGEVVESRLVVFGDGGRRGGRRDWRPRIRVGAAHDALTEHENIEVDKQPERNLGDAEVREQLRLEHRVHHFQRLEFRQQVSADHDIQAITRVQAHAFVNQRQGHLPLMLDAAGGEFEAQRALVVRLVKTGAKFAMDRQRGANERAGVFAAEISVHGDWD